MTANKKGISTGKPPVSYDEMIETVAVIDAGRRSHNKARPVPLKRLR
jgi:hypothetical protein